LRRAIQHNIENPLSKRILDGEFVEGDTILIDSAADGLVFTRK
jgi:ATP-dependent Clp protease ATP-binding subunit ClpB